MWIDDESDFDINDMLYVLEQKYIKGFNLKVTFSAYSFIEPKSITDWFKYNSELRNKVVKIHTCFGGCTQEGYGWSEFSRN